MSLPCLRLFWLWLPFSLVNELVQDTRNSLEWLTGVSGLFDELHPRFPGSFRGAKFSPHFPAKNKKEVRKPVEILDDQGIDCFLIMERDR